MKKYDINRWVHLIALDDVQDGKGSNGNTVKSNSCLLCGRKLKGEAKYFVHLLNDGHLVSNDQPVVESQGFFEIGSECKNRLPNSFVFSINTAND